MFHSNSAIALRKATLAGLGIALLPDYCVAADLAAGALVRVLPQCEITRSVMALFAVAAHPAKNSPAGHVSRGMVQARTLGTVDMNDKADRKVAVVTGGGRGLGAAMALGLARAGYRVVVTAAREAAEIEAIAAEAGDDRVYPLVADVTREEDCERVVDAALARFGSLDILVNNAGRGMKYISSSFMTEPTRFWEADASAWRSVIDTNINGPFLMARAAVRPMLRGRWGQIINISINRDTMRGAGFSPYGPSKAALESETIIWARISPGPV